jgi:hypothetical protein
MHFALLPALFLSVTTIEGSTTTANQLEAHGDLLVGHSGAVAGATAQVNLGFAHGFELSVGLRGSHGARLDPVAARVPSLAEALLGGRFTLATLGPCTLVARAEFAFLWADTWPEWGGSLGGGLDAVFALGSRVTLTVGARGLLLVDTALVPFEGSFPQALGGFNPIGSFVGAGGPDLALTVAVSPRVSLTARGGVLLMAPYGTLRPAATVSVGPEFTL